MPLSPDADGELLDLISTLTDEGQSLQLREAVDDFGRQRVARIIRDGFALVFRATDDEFWAAFPDLSLLEELPPEGAIELFQREPVPLDHRIMGALGALEMQGSAHLLFDYVCDRPDAIGEVRARHGLA